MEVQSSAPPSNAIPRARLWFGATAAAVAWAVQGFACFQIAAQACKDGNGDWGVLSAGGVRILIGVITLLLLAVALSATIVSFRNWRALSGPQPLSKAEGKERPAFMALVGIFAGVAFMVGIIWAGITPILIDVCVNTR